MPSGGITITPGYQLGIGERVNNTKLNQGFQPIGQVNEGAITDRELSGSINNLLGQVPGINQFCNGDFSIWMSEESGVDPATPFTLVIPGGRKVDRTGAAHWFVVNDTNRSIYRQNFPIGQTEVPDHPRYFARWLQSAPVDVAIPTAMFGQRLEDVRRFSDATVTFSIWVRGQGPLTVTPQARQFFGVVVSGPTPSPEVVIPGPAQAILANTWTEIKTTFQIPSVNGKVINDLYFYGGTPGGTFPSFTEFRIVMSHSGAFQIDFAHAMLSYGDAIPGWDARPPNADYLFASRYEQQGHIYVITATGLTTYRPSATLRVPMLAEADSADVTLSPLTGTGATLGTPAGGYRFAVVQANPHSVNSHAHFYIITELHAPN